MDLREAFEHLRSAPIVEAVIHWRARSEAIQNPEQFCELLKGRLKDYPNSQPQHEIEFLAKVGSEGLATTLNRPNWSGFRFNSADKYHIAQFMRDGFSFSRLQPYQDWECFEAEALRLWDLYLELAKPTEVERIGVRFINVISLVEVDELKDILAIPPRSPDTMELSLSSFMHQNTFTIPGSAYKLNVIQTVQPPVAAKAGGSRLILDIDVFTTQVPEMSGDSLKRQLREMRWIKNKAFFTFLSPSAIERFKE